MLFSLKMIALLKAEVSRLRARPKGFPIALWKPSGPPPCCYAFNAAQYEMWLLPARGSTDRAPEI